MLANAALLHARWGGMIRDRGQMAFAVFGNIVTAWSWFGTNMLGVGLHSYGFMDKGFKWLLIFVASQVAFMLIAAIPFRYWRSFKREPDAGSEDGGAKTSKPGIGDADPGEPAVALCLQSTPPGPGRVAELGS